MNERVEVVRPFALVGVAGHQQDGQRRMVAGGRERQRDAVHDRHPDIGEQKLEGAALAGENIERLGAIIGRRDLVPVLLERAGDEMADRFFVFGDENACHVIPLLASFG